MPPIGARLRCTSCQTVQVFGERQNLINDQNSPRRPRRHREIAGRVMFDTRATAANAKHVSPFDDDISDLFKAG
jgi:hypothetical protein